MSDTNNIVKTGIAKPKRVQTDAGTVENHSIDELIKAEQHIMSRSRKGLGIKINRLIPSGTND